MSDLTEFLLARLAEDEANARTYFATDAQDWAERMLAECEAKRRIVERFGAIEADDDIGVTELHLALMHLAAVYGDHPDYDEAWRS